MSEKNLHLVCNAHMDPVWLWEWEEGAAAAISTFRTAADLCEQFDGFVFNHNEAILYKWVEEYEPDLFRRIENLVKEKKWHIMGGWYLQPDCNMPSGESFIRQILVGKNYFKEKFGVNPKTAINFDPFGHTQGLVQIMAQSGYDSYLFCRPDSNLCNLPSEEFIWVGYDGSEILGCRVLNWYNSSLGGAREKVENWLKDNPNEKQGIVLWGVGNHGGGPSKNDLQDLENLINEEKSFTIVHSTPENYFKELGHQKDNLPHHAKDINPWGVGCYTSMIRVKQKHRQLENELYMVEKMASTAVMQGLMPYPGEEIHEALTDLLTGEFHDILPGSSIQPVEETSLRLLDHGLEILSRVKARAFFALSSGQPKAKEGEIPILVYNPHPYKVKGVFECEFQLADINKSETFTMVDVSQNGQQFPAQVEKELSNLNIDWRKRVVFYAELEPSQMNRFDCQLQVIPQKSKINLQELDDKISFQTDDLKVVINTKTGLVDKYQIGGINYVLEHAFHPIVMADNEDPWGMLVKSYRQLAGKFTLMSEDEATRFSGVTSGTIKPVRVIEDGDVRSVVEVNFKYENSAICQRYKLPKQGTEIEVEVRVHWNEKDKMLKLSIPTRLKDSEYLGQVAYGVGSLPKNGDEAVAQKWVAVVSHEQDLAFSCINDGVYGSDFKDGELRLSLLRSPAYAGHPIDDRVIVPQDRYTPRIDQGERLFRFWFNGGMVKDRLEAIDREALVKNEKPFALSFFPPGQGAKPKPGLILSDKVIQVSTMKKAEESDDLIIRLFEPTGRTRSTTLSLPYLTLKEIIILNGFEIKTLRINLITGKMVYVDLMENEIGVDN